MIVGKDKLMINKLKEKIKQCICNEEFRTSNAIFGDENHT